MELIEVIDTPDSINNNCDSDLELYYEAPAKLKVRSSVLYLYNEQINDSKLNSQSQEEMEKAEEEVEKAKKKIINADLKMSNAEKELENAKKEIENAELKMSNAKKEMENAKKEIEKAKKEIKNAKREQLQNQLEIAETESHEAYKYLQESSEKEQESHSQLEYRDQHNKETFVNFWNRPSEERLQISHDNYEHAKKMVTYLSTDYQKYLEGLPISLKYSAIMMGLSNITIESNEAFYMNYVKQGFYIEDKETYKLSYIVDIKTLNL